MKTIYLIECVRSTYYFETKTPPCRFTRTRERSIRVEIKKAFKELFFATVLNRSEHSDEFPASSSRNTTHQESAHKNGSNNVFNENRQPQGSNSSVTQPSFNITTNTNWNSDSVSSGRSNSDNIGQSANEISSPSLLLERLRKYNSLGSEIKKIEYFN